MLFVTVGKVREFLLLNEPDNCVQKFGDRARSPLHKLIFSDKGDILIREKAIEALTILGIYGPNDSGTKILKYEMSEKLEQLPREFKDTFFKFAFSEKSNKGTKLYFIAKLGSPNMVVRNEVREYIRSHNCENLSDLFIECLQNKNIGKDVREAYAEMLAEKRGVEAVASALLTALKNCSVESDIFELDQIVDVLDKLSFSSPELEDVLIKKLQEIVVIDDVRYAARNALRQIGKEWKLDAHGRIIRTLSHKGGKKALRAMSKILASPIGKNPTGLEYLDEELAKATLQRDNYDTTLFFLELTEGIGDLFRKLIKSGEIQSLQEYVEELDNAERELFVKALNEAK